MSIDEESFWGGLMKPSICAWCGNLNDPEFGLLCPCRAWSLKVSAEAEQKTGPQRVGNKS